jgi:hypothetical protein
VTAVVATQRLIASVLVCGAAALGTVLPALAVWMIVLVIFVVLAALETQERFRAAMQVSV